MTFSARPIFLLTRAIVAVAALALLPRFTAADDKLLDFTNAVVVASPKASQREQLAVRMLVEEVENRTGVRWDVRDTRPADTTPFIIVGSPAAIRAHEIAMPDDLRPRPEGYRIGSVKDRPASGVWVAGNNERGVLFGVGRLLRELRMKKGSVTLPAKLDISSAPHTAIRGHQLGYRPKTNSYDGWTVALWEQYLRDLVVFGCNAIELIPPRSDDDADSPLFPLPPLRMMTEVSRLADAYGLDVWIWYPALDANYADPKTVEFALKEWGDVFKALPRVDAVFVPGGDPGHTPPKVLFALLEKQTANLKKYHPKAGMWVSPQGFTAAWMKEFFELLRAEPAWLAGVAHGPQIRVDFAEFRAAVPKKYPIRDYPDITHSRHCQYPVPDWDLAFALLQGREVSNPRPLAMAGIYRRTRPHVDGFITYSEGCHDDVNKVVWSALGWDEKADVHGVLREYARYFIHPDFEVRFADGLLGLERNWVGPVLANKGIDETLKRFIAMEKDATPAVKLNWRFQQALYRACYDALAEERTVSERTQEEIALKRLKGAPQRGSLGALSEAEEVLDQTSTNWYSSALRARLFETAEALFQSIRAQLSVKKYHAIAVERGANLDTIDFPLNDAGYLKKKFAHIRELPDEPARLAAIKALLNRTDPGPGGFYDQLGDPAKRPHLVLGEGPDRDPLFFRSPLTGFSFRAHNFDPTLPRAWLTHAETLYDTPLVMRYPDLDRKAAYKVRVVYNRERVTSAVRLTANDKFEVHDFTGRAREELEFDVPKEATATGTLTLKWAQKEGSGGSGRGCQVAEVWLLKQPGPK